MAVTQITLASTDASGIQGNGNSRRSALSADGQFVAFESDASNLVVGDANGAQDIFLKNLDTGVVRLVSTASDGAQGVGHSSFGGISADGRFVAFNSPATTLVAGDANGKVDVFVKDLATGAVTLASVAADGTRGTAAASPAALPAAPSRPTGALWRSRATPPTLSRATPTASRTSSSRTWPPAR